ncbi:putative membrane-associated protein [Lapidilactobacillus concavus DSM 17758]|uniref:Putative membrane-associated protein n=1 Tax=Lapidilactobacillus concavus DSM 17758 TaxID=1423735 RepID=A0A0R1VX56_9LACO|nr:VTT domain-containing protein [Lapidilactobacillus concavus]KRM10280.1 putative membrane-associated protein [Lapidilactobacillus concavus DSM 17758]GEL13775.1 membrane protein [Lapidilactobacillus concavus]
MPFIDFFLHIDQHLFNLVNQFGGWSYLILFIMIFIETGVVIFPFLPGDSLLFAAAALAATGKVNLNIFVLFVIFLSGAVLGDTMNYHIGIKVGLSASKNSFFSKMINQDKMAAAERFFEKHGGKTIALARFVPFIRTFAPFVSGGSKMNYHHFLLFNFIGGLAWVTLCLVGGYFFGNISFVSEHFTLVALGIVFVSLIPVGVISLQNRLKKA